MTHELIRSDIALLDPEKEMLSFAAGLIGRSFLDDEVFRRLLDSTGDAGHIRSKERELAQRAFISQTTPVGRPACRLP